MGWLKKALQSIKQFFSSLFSGSEKSSMRQDTENLIDQGVEQTGRVVVAMGGSEFVVAKQQQRAQLGTARILDALSSSKKAQQEVDAVVTNVAKMGNSISRGLDTIVTETATATATYGPTDAAKDIIKGAGSNVKYAVTDARYALEDVVDSGKENLKKTSKKVASTLGNTVDSGKKHLKETSEKTTHTARSAVKGVGNKLGLRQRKSHTDSPLHSAASKTTKSQGNRHDTAHKEEARSRFSIKGR